MLVLSQFAGAARELDQALLVNPHEIDAVSGAIKRALEMPLEERRERHAPMLAHLQANDITKWAEDYLTNLADARSARRLLNSLRTLFGSPQAREPIANSVTRFVLAATPSRGPSRASKSAPSVAGTANGDVRPRFAHQSARALLPPSSMISLVISSCRSWRERATSSSSIFATLLLAAVIARIRASFSAANDRVSASHSSANTYSSASRTSSVCGAIEMIGVRAARARRKAGEIERRERAVDHLDLACATASRGPR